MTCRSCNAPLVWVKSRAGKPIPCDPAVLSVVTDEGDVVRGRISHFASCPQAAQHRKAKPKTAALFPEEDRS